MKQKSPLERALESPYFWGTVTVILTFFFYLPSLTGELTNWDDLVYIRDNPYIKSLSSSNIAAIFSNNYMGNYHPLSMLSLAIDYQITKLNPLGYHLTNLLLHILNSLLVMIVIGRLTGKQLIGGFAGLIFGVHTFHVESVAWISERKDVLYTFFYLLSVNSYIEYVLRKKKSAYLITILFFLISLLSKGQAVTLPFTLVLIDIFLGHKWVSVKLLIEKVPFFVLSLVFGIVAINAQAGADATIMANFPIQQRIAFASYGLLMYVIKLFFPFSLSAYYPYPIISEAGEVPFLYWFMIVPALGFLGLWVYSYRKSKPLFFGMGFFILNIFLLLQLLPVGRAIMADRYVYIPSIGFAFLAAWYLNDQSYVKNRYVSLVILFCYALILGVMTFNRTKVWQSSMTLWSDVLEKNSQVPVAWYNRGNIFMEKGEHQSAIDDYNACLNVDPDYWKAYINRGNAKNELKNYLGAVADFDEVIRRDSLAVNAYINRANSKRQLKDFFGAMTDYNKALRMKPDQVELYTSRSNLKVDMKDYQGAIADLETALQINPDYIAAYSNRAIIRKITGDTTGSLSDYNRAIDLDPSNYDLLVNRGNLKFQSGDDQGALSDYNEAIRLKPDQYLGYKNRGAFYISKQEFKAAISDFREATRINPGSGELHYNHAIAAHGAGENSEAAAAYKKAVSVDPIYASADYAAKAGVSAAEIGDLQPTQLNSQGLSVESAGKVQEAIGLYQRAVSLKPDFAEAWFNLGNAFGKTGRFNDAVESMNKAIKYKPDYPEAFSARGIAYASLGKADLAVRDLTAAINSNPKYAAAYYNRAILYINQKKKDLACIDLKKAVELGYTAAYSIYQKECQK